MSMAILNEAVQVFKRSFYRATLVGDCVVANQFNVAPQKCIQIRYGRSDEFEVSIIHTEHGLITSVFVSAKDLKDVAIKSATCEEEDLPELIAELLVNEAKALLTHYAH